MDEEIGRKWMQELLEVQVGLLKAYETLLKSDQWNEARRELREALKATVIAMVPLSAALTDAAKTVVDGHTGLVARSRELLEDLLKEQKERAERY